MKNFDDLFRDELADHAEVPHSRVWENLEQRLNANAAGGKTPFGKGWYWMVGVASVAVVLGGLGWNMVNRDAVPAAVPIAMTATATNIPVMEEPATMPEQAANTVRKNIAAVHHSARNNEQVAEEQADEVSAYGNAAATGTKLHSYDDFDERAVAGTQKLAPLNSDEEHAANGYKVNKIRKHRMIASEMVPVHQQQQVYAAVTNGAALPTEAKKPAPAATRTPVRTIASKVAANNGGRKAVVLVNETDKAGTAENQAATEATPAAETPTAATAPAERPVATSPLPVPAGTATAARSKPASEIAAPTKPTTGGSEPARADSQEAKQLDNDANATEEEKKGLFGIFKKKKK